MKGAQGGRVRSVGQPFNRRVDLDLEPGREDDVEPFGVVPTQILLAQTAVPRESALTEIGLELAAKPGLMGI